MTATVSTPDTLVPGPEPTFIPHPGRRVRRALSHRPVVTGI